MKASASTSDDGRARRALLLGAFSVVVLASQVALTRILAVVFFYHFAFLILSTSLLGFGLGGLVVRLMRPRLERWDPTRVLVVGVAGSGVLLVASLLVITRVHFEPKQVDESIVELAKLSVSATALVLPFAAMGATVLFILQRWARGIGGLYAANLVGSGLGCLLVIVALNVSGGLVTLVVLATSLPFLASWYGWSSCRRPAVGALALGALLALFVPTAESVFPLSRAVGKQYTCRDPQKIVFSDWTAVSKVDICPDEDLDTTRYGLWGLSKRAPGDVPRRLGAVIDSWAYTTILEHEDDPNHYDFIDWMPLYLAYEWSDRPRVLIIGSGGGMDIRAAVVKGARKVDAVEINPSIFRAMHHELAEYSGNVYTLPGVTGHLAEGRSFVESADEPYDLIQLSGVDTLSATQTGAFALTESFLYTREAFRSYLEKLDEDGTLTLTRWYLPGKDGRPRHSLKLFALAVESLADMGVAEPGRHIVFLRSGPYTVLLVKRRPVTTSEVAIIERHLVEKGFGYLYCPYRTPARSSEFYEYLAAPDRRQWIAAYPYNIEPPTDDSPFYFELRKIGDVLRFPSSLSEYGANRLSVLVVLFVEMLVAGLVLLVLSFRLQRGRTRPLGWLYFLAIGLGFMLVEVTLSQRLVLFLGHPTYALSVVLFTVLVFSGAGSALSGRMGRMLSQRIWLGAVGALMLAWAAFGTPVLRSLVGWPEAAKIGTAVGLMAPVAFLMGTAFPEAVRRLTASGEEDLGVYWAWNGVGSVLASTLAVVLAMSAGFSAVMVVSAACYGVAALALPPHARVASRRGSSPRRSKLLEASGRSP